MTVFLLVLGTLLVSLGTAYLAGRFIRVGMKEPELYEPIIGTESNPTEVNLYVQDKEYTVYLYQQPLPPNATEQDQKNLVAIKGIYHMPDGHRVFAKDFILEWSFIRSNPLWELKVGHDVIQNFMRKDL